MSSTQIQDIRPHRAPLLGFGHKAEHFVYFVPVSTCFVQSIWDSTKEIESEASYGDLPTDNEGGNGTDIKLIFLRLLG